MPLFGRQDQRLVNTGREGSDAFMTPAEADALLLAISRSQPSLSTRLARSALIRAGYDPDAEVGSYSRQAQGVQALSEQFPGLVRRDMPPQEPLPPEILAEMAPATAPSPFHSWESRQPPQEPPINWGATAGPGSALPPAMPPPVDPGLGAELRDYRMPSQQFQPPAPTPDPGRAARVDEIIMGLQEEAALNARLGGMRETPPPAATIPGATGLSMGEAATRQMEQLPPWLRNR